MRTNLPVTQQEYEIPEGLTLVSTTDLDSRITYCNPAFIEVSGYEAGELIGQPHNLVRHPDMPPEAFRDMWATVKGGQPWSQLVKNRRKNGDHYWVLANVTPILDASGQVAGYMSVRTRPSRDQVQGAEALYARMRRESQAGGLTVRLRGGRLEGRGLAARLGRLGRLNLTARMTAALVAMAAFSAVAGMLVHGSGWLAIAAGLATKVGLIAVLGWWLHRTVTEPVRRVSLVANRMAAGDLTQSVSSRRTDEIGGMLRALNQLNVNLQAMVFDVRSQSGQVDRAADEIASSGQDLSSRTEAQAGSLQETAAAIEQIAATVRQNAGNAEEASRRAGDAGEVAEQSSRAVREVHDSMRGIEAASSRIAAINGVIDGIAFQTNILALNAAVEAARAGEQGRGFAVVAGEVRTLAQRSAAAAKEIKQLIDESRGAVEGGSRLVETAGSTLAQAVQAARSVGSLVEGISLASNQQSTGVLQINAAVAQLDTATQQNAAMVEESAAAAARLKHQAQALTQAVQIFKVKHA